MYSLSLAIFLDEMGIAPSSQSDDPDGMVDLYQDVFPIPLLDIE